jgi:hypothetical protein
MKKIYRVPWWVFVLALLYAIYKMFSRAANSSIGYDLLTTPQTKPEEFLNFTITNFANTFWSNLFSWFLIFLFISWITWKLRKETPNNQKESVDNQNYLNDPATHSPREIITYVVGVTFEGRQEIIKRLKVGDIVDLRRERDNPNDPNAICVCVSAGFRTSAMDGKFGYINRDLAKEIAPIFDLFVPIDNIPHQGKIIGLLNEGTDHMGVKIKFMLPNDRDYDNARLFDAYDRY